MAQQTAIEWLMERLRPYVHYPYGHSSGYDMEDVIEQAKQKEKEQIMKAWELRATPYPTEGMGYSIIDATGEEYYNETYIENKD